MHIIITIVMGFIVGVIAKLLMPGKDPGGFIITTLLGIAGALLATFLNNRVLHIYEPTTFANFIGAIVGALILLIIYRLLRGKKSSA